MFSADELWIELLGNVEFDVVGAEDAADKLSGVEFMPDVRLIFARRFLNQNCMFFGSSFGNFCL